MKLLIIAMIQITFVHNNQETLSWKNSKLFLNISYLRSVITAVLHLQRLHKQILKQVYEYVVKLHGNFSFYS